jgi:SAM-dependent methyltransferase
MAHRVCRVCPWWLGYLLASPLRRLLQDPQEVVNPYVREGMTVLEPGPGMGFFTLALARRVGPSGKVIAIDLQPRMLASLQRRAARAGLQQRVETRQASANNLGISDLNGSVDFTLAFALVHELPSPRGFFQELAQASKPHAGLLFAEPSGHVNPEEFEAGVQAAVQFGFQVVERPRIRRSHAALLRKSA